MRKSIFSSALTLILSLLVGLWLMLTGAAEGSAPVAENFEFETYRGVSFGGRLSAVDPEGDPVSFEITTQPVKGKLTISEDGGFVYTPSPEKRGKDYFDYKATDADGNSSQEATVIIRLVKQKSAIAYQDMDGDPSHRSAIRLADCGAFVGKQIGLKYYFEPAETMSRGEFLSLCLEATGADILSGVSTTGFTDDAEIPAWEKCYVSTGVRDGVIKGRSSAGGAVFDADAEISCAEAAVMLDRCLKLNDVSYVN